MHWWIYRGKLGELSPLAPWHIRKYKFRKVELLLRSSTCEPRLQLDFYIVKVSKIINDIATLGPIKALALLSASVAPPSIPLLIT